MKDNLVLIDADSIIYIATYNKVNEPERTIEEMFSVCDSILDNIMLNTNSKFYAGFLTEGKCFRYNIGKIKEYKGNRVDFIKPKYYNLVKAYLQDKLNFKYLIGYEADDLCIMSYHSLKDNYNIIISSPDKDLRQVPCIFYDYKKEFKIEIDKAQADINLWTQVLTGDVSDNIAGCRGIGAVKANNILKDNCTCYTALKCFIDTYGEYEGIINFTENYRLVKMLERTKEGELYYPLITEYKREEEKSEIW